MTALDEVWCFLTDQGYELEEGHIVRRASGTVLAENPGETMNHFETWLVVVHKLHGPNSSSVQRVVNRPTRAGLRLTWGDDSDN